MSLDPLAQYRRIVIFGGTFDPPHNAHVQLPEEVRRHLDADAVAYIPTANQPLKRHRKVAAAVHRVAMLRLALADAPHAHVLTDEIDRASDGRPSYTVDTLDALRDRLGDAVQLRLLIGADQARDFHRWYEHERVEQLAEPVVMLRPPDTAESLLTHLDPRLDADVWRGRLVPVSQIDLSATAVRECVAMHEPFEHMVPDTVARYIVEHGLYVDPSPTV